MLFFSLSKINIVNYIMIYFTFFSLSLILSSSHMAQLMPALCGLENNALQKNLKKGFAVKNILQYNRVKLIEKNDKISKNCKAIKLQSRTFYST